MTTEKAKQENGNKNILLMRPEDGEV